MGCGEAYAFVLRAFSAPDGRFSRRDPYPHELTKPPILQNVANHEGCEACGKTDCAYRRDEA